MEITLNKAVELLDTVVFEVVNGDLYINPIILDEINTFLNEYYMDTIVDNSDIIVEDIEIEKLVEEEHE